jgi:hypothetical protein
MATGIHVRQVRGIPLWLLREYLQELGGEVDENGRVVGAGWVATLTPQEPFQLGSLRVGQLELHLQGSQQALDALLPRLDKKTMRAGA